MRYQLKDGSTVRIDQPFKTTNAAGELIQFPANWLRLSTPEDRARFEIVELAPPTPPQEQPPSKEALIAYASDKRWRVETGGITVSGMTVPTDDRAKLLILGAAQTLADDASAPMVVNGSVLATLTGAQFRAINAAIISHVQSSFSALATIIAAINADTITTKEDIETNGAWPG